MTEINNAEAISKRIGRLAFLLSSKQFNEAYDITEELIANYPDHYLSYWAKVLYHSNDLENHFSPSAHDYYLKAVELAADSEKKQIAKKYDECQKSIDALKEVRSEIEDFLSEVDSHGFVYNGRVETFSNSLRIDCPVGFCPCNTLVIGDNVTKIKHDGYIVEYLFKSLPAKLVLGKSFSRLTLSATTDDEIILLMAQPVTIVSLNQTPPEVCGNFNSGDEPIETIDDFLNSLGEDDESDEPEYSEEAFTAEDMENFLESDPPYYSNEDIKGKELCYFTGNVFVLPEHLQAYKDHAFWGKCNLYAIVPTDDIFDINGFIKYKNLLLADKESYKTKT